MSFKLHSLSEVMVVVAIAAIGCKQDTSKLEAEPAPGARVATKEPAPPPRPPTQSFTPAEAEAQAFCEKTMQRVLDCFKDDGFWDVFATTFFAKYPDTTGNPDAKKMWIGMRKDDIVGLRQDNQLAQNCTVMVRGTRLPTAEDMQPVVTAMGKSCTDFGTAMGFMLFHKGIFHMPR